TPGECMAVLAERLSKFQIGNSKVRFHIVAMNAGNSPNFEADMDEVVAVAKGQKPSTKIQFVDSNDLFSKAIVNHRAPGKGDGTLDDAAVDAAYKEWVDDFMSKVSSNRDVLNDRATARLAYDGINAETYSMIHKSLELPTTRATLLKEGSPTD